MCWVDWRRPRIARRPASFASFDVMSLNQIFDIPIREIEVSEENIRVHSAFRDLDELAASIQKLGLLQPIVLLGSPGAPPYKVISGQRRLLAHQKLKAK